MSNITCPACGKERPPNLESCVCGADLRLLVQVNQLCDTWFNQGVQAARAEHPGEAVFWLSACCAASPGDAAAWLAHARAWGQLGRWQEALASLEHAYEINPQLSDLPEVRECLDVMRSQREKLPGEA